MDVDVIYLGMIWYVVFLFSTTLHEAAHAYVALKLGDPTAYEGGQVTLEPMPHIQREPVGMVVVPIISYILQGGNWMIGWASAPYDPFWAGRYPKRAAYMALAGPVSNLLLCLIAVFLIHIGIMLGYFFEPESITSTAMMGVYNNTGIIYAVGKILSILCYLNLILFVFNLLPFPPLDGSSLFPLFMNEETALKIMGVVQQPGLMFFGLIIAWYSFDIIFSPIYLFFLNFVLYPGSSYG